MTILLKILSRYDELSVAVQVGATLHFHRCSLESFGLGPLFPGNPNCGLFMVFLFRSTSTLKTFASYLFRHSQPEISVICHVTIWKTRIKLLHLLVPLLFATFIVPLIWFVSDPGHCHWLEEFAWVRHNSWRPSCSTSLVVIYPSHSFRIILLQSNVLRSEGHCYLVDFGIAKMPTMSTLATFAKMVHCGWAAPELDQQPRSKQSDIFSFACTIYEVLVYFLDLSFLFMYLCA